MIHQKLAGLMSPAERIARVASGAFSAAAAQATAPSGSASYDNADGSRTVIGGQAGDYTLATHVGDAEPPGRPMGVQATSSAGCVYVGWDGTLEGGVPPDFLRVTAHVSVAGVEDSIGTLTAAGVVSTPRLATTATVEAWLTAEDDACLEDGTPAHNVSTESDHVSVAVNQAADQAAVDALEASVTGAVATANEARETADAASEAASRASADAAGAVAETRDLVTLRIDSSRGTVFKNDSMSTVLTVRCYKRGSELTTRQALRDALGDQTARVRWWVLREGDSDWVSIADSDPMLSGDGFALTVTPEDVSVKCTFKCEVVAGE